jgi:3-dehydroquinate dehydratase/shikimate dehydrogenase
MEEKNLTRLCVSICESRAAELAQSAAEASATADLVELRMDCLPSVELTLALRQLDALQLASPCPFVMTLRPAEQGGRREIDALNRLAFWVENFLYGEQYHGFADIECELLLLIHQSEDERWKKLDWARVICSHHDFTGTPRDLDKIYERMAATPAPVLKIAVHAADVTDCIPVFHLLDRARREGREIIAIAMGEAGVATRILGPSRGAFMTYGSLDSASPVAPGQLSAADLTELYRIRELDRETEVMGLVGSPVAHSISPQIHNAAIASRSLNAVYIPFEVREVKDFIRRMVDPRTRELDWRLRGLSVTAPHKSACLEMLDELRAPAREIGAVNTILIEAESLIGYNTDAEAFLAPLQRRSIALRGARCAILGAGGAALSVLWALEREGAEVTVFARDMLKARPLAEKFGARCASHLDARFEGFELVINATPLGTRGYLERETPAVSSQLQGARFVYDLVYNPSETRLIREAAEAGLETIGGLEMLLAQAAAQFRLWTGTDAPLKVMQEAAERALRSSSSTSG